MKCTHRLRCAWLGALAGGCLMAAAPRAEQVAPAGSPSTEWETLRDETFMTVWATVNEAYYDATFGGVDWVAVREKYRGSLAGVRDQEGLRQLLQHMLGELQRSHFSIMPREAAVFTPAERVRLGTTGVRVAFVEGVVAVTEIAQRLRREHRILPVEAS